MERVHFVAPVSANDLRLVLSHTSAVRHDQYQVEFLTPFGEARAVKWLTAADAFNRANLLRGRGYKAVNVEPMAVH